LASPITRERAERIARAHACERCGEYSFKKLVVKPASASLRAELDAVWVATKICGVCGLHQELGLDEDGDVVYVS
jgi:transcription elongation factor Elf1